MKDFTGIFVFTVLILVCQAQRAHGQACNMTQAETCVRSMEMIVGRFMGVTSSESLQRLCLDMIKGNNLTQCYIEATEGCGDADATISTKTVQDWERVMQNLYEMCDGACPEFLERTINMTQCTSLIQFDDLNENSYTTFCRSLNASLECSREASSECPAFFQLFYDLLPRGIDEAAETICTSECDNFDKALRKLETCKTFVATIPEDFETACSFICMCSAYGEFRACLHVSDMPITCPMFGALMDVLYPMHIFGLYEENCNITDEDSDKCGSRGTARMDHCLRIFALAWPEITDTPEVTKEQCGYVHKGFRCLDISGFNECPNLRQYVIDRTASKQKHREVLEKGCPDAPEEVEEDDDLDNSVGCARSQYMLTRAVTSLGLTLLLGRLLR